MSKLYVRPAQILRWTAFIVTLMLAAALCLSCLALYRAGTAGNLAAEGVIFTRTNVKQKLAELAPLAVCWAILMILAAFLPKEFKQPGLDPENALRLIRPRIEETPAMLRQQRNRRLCRAGSGAILAACLGKIALYMADVNHFSSWDLETVMADMMRALTPPAILAILCLCGCEFLLGRSYAAEWKAAKAAPRRAVPVEKCPSTTTFPVNAARVVIAATAAGFLLAGVLNGGMYDVLVKAINICTECIGLG